MTNTNLLDFTQVAAALREIDYRLVHIYPPTGGLTGNVSMLETDEKELVLRIFDDTAAAWKPEKERIVYALMRQQGIPVPNILTTDASKSVLPFTYVISERLPGVALAECNDDILGPEDRNHIYAQLGDYLGRMHSVSFPVFGDVIESEGRIDVGPAGELRDSADRGHPGHPGPFDSWREMHRQIVRRHLAFLKPTVFGDLVESLGAWFTVHDYLLDDAITPRLLHMDLHRGNILVSGDQVTGILDIEESLVGHNEYDLMRTELAHFRYGDEGIQSAFFEAYTRHISLAAGYEARRPFYEVSRSLVRMRCLVTYGSQYAGDTEDEERTIRTTLQTLMQSGAKPGIIADLPIAAVGQ